ncbi:nitrate regulatory protein [Azoarcus olearius]|uniref:Probable nitrate regulatory protein n=1 Tax=Azoarcus sp. (strain BH72) TaxID=418699 RepID=A1K403_AZOSB|nr:nitrate regulatory protein [Azoarcus olearius]CAL93558.1 probable nitrate regulatory protein [Azoarcus olearius]
MKSALGFLVAAKRCEIHGLEQLEVTCGLVKGVSELVHMLQKERGASNVFLASRGSRFADKRSEQVAATEAVEIQVRDLFDRLATDSARMAGGMRLFSRIAYVLHALNALPALREQIEGLHLGPEQATHSFSELIAGLLAVVFEAADTAVDPAISRALVSLFNFMQGKELAGQERAVGAAALAAGRFEAGEQQRMLHLIEAQERCFQLFIEFADPTLRTIWRNAQVAPEIAELERMRRIATTTPAGRPVDDTSQRWFDCATARIDVMRQVEDCATNALLQLCENTLAAARTELAEHAALLDTLEAAGGPDVLPPAALSALVERAGVTAPAGAPAAPEALHAADGLGPQLGRSVFELMQDQAQRLQTMSDELNTVRAALNERKVVERAKGLLMASRGLSEEEAYKLLRQTAMNQNRRLVEVAEATLALADVLRSE